jgi:hypothetical protein
MSPFEAELYTEYQAVLLEVLVPYWVQKRIPEVRLVWREVLATKDGARSCEAAFTRALRVRRSAGETVRMGIAKADPAILSLKKALYNRLGRRHDLMTAFIGRTATVGNEQCPYWPDFAYTEPPRGGNVKAGR